MIVESKILLELDVPTISGYIYPKEFALGIIKTIKNEYITGDILLNPTDEPIYTENKFRIINPYVTVDNSVSEYELIILCDVEIDENKLTSEELNAIKTKPWRLSVVGIGDADDNMIIDYELKYVNIEII